MVCSVLCYFTCSGSELQIKGITWLLLLYQAHPWFNGIDWDRIYQMEAAFTPEVNDELDTQNFEKFDEVLLPPNSLVGYVLGSHATCNSLYLSYFCLFCVCSLTTNVKVRQNQVHGER